MKRQFASYRWIPTIIVALAALPMLSTHTNTRAQAVATNATHAASAPAITSRAASNAGEAGPAWNTLTAAQKTALSPLANEWKNIDANRKQKWTEIANRYQKLSPEEKGRAQQRMRDWVKLTPEQRMRARENFALAAKLKSDKKVAQWQRYQELSEEQKKQLAASKQKKMVTNLPVTAVNTKPDAAPVPLPAERPVSQDANANPG